MPAPRAVLDTNVFVSALLGNGPPARIYEAFAHEAFWLVTSKALLAEIAEVLLRPTLRIPPDDVKSAFRLLQRRALIIRPTHHITACRDPKDNLVLECAASGAARWLVTGDHDLLALHPFHGIRIVSPAAFLKTLPL